MVRTGEDAVNWAKRRDYWHSGMCQQFVRMCFDVGSYYGSASLAWRNADHKHPTENTKSIPRAVPVFWTGGSHGYGHVAISLGNGLCRSTDWPRSGHVSTARISDITRAWHLNFAGWTEDINNRRVYVPKKESAAPHVDTSDVKAAAENTESVRWGRMLKHVVAAEVGKGEMKMTSSVLGPGFVKQYKLVQRKWARSTGSRLTAAEGNGIPGMVTLTWLGYRHGFEVRP